MCQSCYLYSGHPWIIHGHLPPTPCQSIHGCRIRICTYDIHGTSMDVQPLPHPVSEYPWMPHTYTCMYLGYQWNIHGRPTFPPPCVKVSMDAAYIQTIHGSSMDVQPSPHPVSEYPWMPHILRPSMDHPWTSNLPRTLCQSIHGCRIYSGHP